MCLQRIVRVKLCPRGCENYDSIHVFARVDVDFCFDWRQNLDEELLGFLAIEEELLGPGLEF